MNFDENVAYPLITTMFFGFALGVGIAQPEWQPWAMIFGIFMFACGLVFIVAKSGIEDDPL